MPDTLVVVCACRRVYPVGSLPAICEVATCRSDLGGDLPRRRYGEVLALLAGQQSPARGPEADSPRAVPARVRCPYDGCTAEYEHGVESICPRCEESLPPLLWLGAGERRVRVEGRTILGREGDLAADVFASTLQVSRRHVGLHVADGQWYVEVLASATNLTWLDGQLLGQGSRAALVDRHALTMSRHCTVSLEVQA